MNAAAFDYVAPRTLAEAAAALAETGEEGRLLERSEMIRHVNSYIVVNDMACQAPAARCLSPSVTRPRPSCPLESPLIGALKHFPERFGSVPARFIKIGTNYRSRQTSTRETGTLTFPVVSW